MPDNVLDLGPVYRILMSIVQSGECIELEHDPQKFLTNGLLMDLVHKVNCVTETRCSGQGVLWKAQGCRMVLFVECGPSVKGHALDLLSPATAADLRIRTTGWKGPGRSSTSTLLP